MESELLHLIPNRFKSNSHVVYLLLPAALFVLVLFFVSTHSPSPKVEGAHIEINP